MKLVNSSTINRTLINLVKEFYNWLSKVIATLQVLIIKTFVVELTYKGWLRKHVWRFLRALNAIFLSLSRAPSVYVLNELRNKFDIHFKPFCFKRNFCKNRLSNDTSFRELRNYCISHSWVVALFLLIIKVN